jgi:hypothetical protein
MINTGRLLEIMKETGIPISQDGIGRDSNQGKNLRNDVTQLRKDCMTEARESFIHITI